MTSPERHPSHLPNLQFMSELSKVIYEDTPALASTQLPLDTFQWQKKSLVTHDSNMEEGAFLIILEFYCQVEDFIKCF